MSQIELLPIKNAYYLGAYSKVLTDIQNLSPTLQVESRPIAFKALIAQKKYETVIKAIVPNRDPPSLVSIQILAKYYYAVSTSPNTNKSSIVQEMRDLVEAGNNKFEPLIQWSAGTLFYAEGLYEDAMVLLIQSPKDMECVALVIQIYLKLDRADMAKKELLKLKSWADDATLAQLVEAWVNLQAGGEERYRESAYVYEELASSKIATPKMLNGHAVCLMAMGRFAEAEAQLFEALKKNPSDVDVLANLALVSNALNKPEHAQNSADRKLSSYFAYNSQLKGIQSSHHYLQFLAEKSALFDTCAARFKK